MSQHMVIPGTPPQAPSWLGWLTGLRESPVNVYWFITEHVREDANEQPDGEVPRRGADGPVWEPLSLGAGQPPGTRTHSLLSSGLVCRLPLVGIRPPHLQLPPLHGGWRRSATAELLAVACTSAASCFQSPPGVASSA